MEKSSGKTVMVVEVTGKILRAIRSSGLYANLSGHQVDYIAFLTHQGTFLGEVKQISRNVPLEIIYSGSESESRTTRYRIGPLKRHDLRRNSKLPRGRKRVVDYEKFLRAKQTSELFRSRRDGAF